MGQDFHPSYLNIADFTNELPKRAIIGAFTATTTQEVKRDIISILGLNFSREVTTGFDKPNQLFSVIRPSSKLQILEQPVRERGGKAGIIYCSTRKRVEEVCDSLCAKDFNATRYHAELNLELTDEQNDAFKKKEEECLNFVVAHSRS